MPMVGDTSTENGWDGAYARKSASQGRESVGNCRDFWPHMLHWRSFGKSQLLKFPTHC